MQTTPKFKSLPKALPLLCACCFVALGLCQVWLLVFPRKASAARTSAPKTIRVSLHGSTPTMAWSPDSKHLAANASYEYYGFDNLVKTHKKNLGVYLATVATGKVNRITDQQGYHPLWIDKSTLAWGHSPYEDGTAGLYVSDIKKRKVKRLGKYKGVYNTRAYSTKKILFYSGWPEYKKWVLADVRTGKITPYRVKTKARPPARPPSSKGSAASSASWTPPAGAINQCRQKVGKITAGASTSSGIWVVTKNQSLRLAPTAYLFYNYGSRRCSVGFKHCGAVQPCISPDGRHIAFVTFTATTGVFELTVAPLSR